MGKRNLWVERSLTSRELDAQVSEFLSSGGEIIRCKEDDGSYDKNQQKTKARLKGGFNPFTKDQALRRCEE